MSLQGNLSIERMCQLAQVSRAGFYRSLQERLPVEEEMEVRSTIRQLRPPIRSMDFRAVGDDEIHSWVVDRDFVDCQRICKLLTSRLLSTCLPCETQRGTSYFTASA